jgi:hypothetical protein
MVEKQSATNGQKNPSKASLMLMQDKNKKANS